MKLSIIIPVFNEEKTIAHVINKVSDVDLGKVTKQIIIVNDGSRDRTEKEIQQAIKKQKDVTVISYKLNQGKGAAVVSGMKSAKGDYILIQDADLEYNPEDIKKLLVPILKNQSQVVYGTRLKRLPDLKKDERTLRNFIQYTGNKFLSLVTSLLFGQWITDMETGYKLFPRAATQDMTLHARSFELEPEITAKLLKRKYKIIEIPISTNPRGKDEGKKLSAFRDGPIALWTLVKYRFVD